MKPREDLNVLKEEVESLNRKLAELSEEELTQVTGGAFKSTSCPFCTNRAIWVGHIIEFKRDFYKCPECGILTYFWNGARWEKGAHILV